MKYAHFLKQTISLFICIITLATCTIRGKSAKLQNQQHEKRTIKNKDSVALIPEEIVLDILQEYPEITHRIALLQTENPDPLVIPKTLLLVGKPGCSKTTIAIAITQALDRKIAVFQATSLVGDKYQNSGVNFLEKKLGTITKELEQNPHVKYVIVIDEVMRLAEHYESDRGDARNIATKLWLLMDQLNQSNRVFFIATANEIDKLPEQISSRFAEDNIIEITPPNANYRRKILLNHLQNKHKLTNDELKAIVDYTDGLTHRELKSIVERAAFNSTKKDLYENIITYEFLLEAIRTKKDISFLGRRICNPAREWIGDWITKPYNRFWRNNEKTLENITNFSIITTIIAMIYIYSLKKRSANITTNAPDPEITRVIQVLEYIYTVNPSFIENINESELRSLIGLIMQQNKDTQR